MQEKYIEQKLVATVKSMGGMAPKFVSPGIDGMVLVRMISNVEF